MRPPAVDSNSGRPRFKERDTDRKVAPAGGRIFLDGDGGVLPFFLI